MKNLFHITSNFYIIQNRLLTSCILVLMTVCFSNSIKAQLPDSLLKSTDTNFYQITSKVDEFLFNRDTSSSSSFVSSEDEEDGWEANYGKWRTYWQSRLGEDAGFRQANIQMRQFNSNDLNCYNSDNKANWKNIGPINSSEGRRASPSRVCSPGIVENNHGWVASVCVNALNPNTIYLGSDAGGVWKTYDGGQHWENITDGYLNASTGVLSILINPSDTNNIFIATGVQSIAFGDIAKATYTVGVLMSRDGGETWYSTSIMGDISTDANNSIPRKLVIDPRSTPLRPIIYIMFDNEVKTMVYTNDYPSSSVVSSLIMNNYVPSSVAPRYGKYTNFDFEIDPITFDLWLANEEGLFKKTATSTTFSLINNYIIPSIFDYNPTHVYDILHPNQYVVTGRIGIDITKTSSTSSRVHIYIRKNELTAVFTSSGVIDATGYISHNGFCQYTNDGGVTWSNYKEILGPEATSPASNRDYIFEVNDLNSDIIYSSQQFCLLKSTNGGETFSLTDFSRMHVDPRCIQLYAASLDGQADIIYVGEDGGIGKTIDGNLFHGISGYGLSIGEYVGLSVSEQNSKLIIAGGYHGSIDKYENGKWGKTEASGDCGEAIIDPIDNNIIHYSANWRYLRSTNGGLSFSYTSEGISADFLLFPMELDPNNNQILYKGKFELWRSINQGASWTEITPTYVDKDARISSVCVAPSNSNHLYFAREGGYSYYDGVWTYKGGIYSTTNSLSSTPVYIDITNELGRKYFSTSNFVDPLYHGCTITDIEVDPLNENRVWITLGGFYSGHKVYVSTDGGASWTNMSAGLPNMPSHTIIYQKESDDILYVGTDVGVYYWDKNDGSSGMWKKFCSGLPICIVNDIEINYCGQKLRVATWGRGIWEADLLPIVEKIIPSYTQLIYEDGLEHQMNQSIHLSAYSQLIVRNGTTLNMAAGKRIMVEPSATLLVDHGTLTNACNTMWEGIVVKGTNSEAQHPFYISTSTPLYLHSATQGMVQLNYATISNAKEAIRLWDVDDAYVSSVSGDPTGKTGGIVLADHSTFLNNRRSAEFMYYHYFDPISGIEIPNASHFRSCTFTTDDNHGTEAPFNTHVTLWGVYGVEVSSSMFNNNKTAAPAGTATSAELMGMGIYSIDASYSVKYSGFQSLTRGVRVLNSGTLAAVNIFRDAFKNNLTGLNLIGSNLSTVRRNSFFSNPEGMTVVPPSYLIPVGSGFIASSKYTFNSNFFKSTGLLKSSIGSWFSDNGSDDNLSFSNGYYTLKYGALANYLNRNTLGSKGLQFKCNKNTQNEKDFTVYSPGSTPAMGYGIKDNQGLPTEFVANTFSVPPGTDAFAHFEQVDANHVKYFVPPEATSYLPVSTKCTSPPFFNIIFTRPTATSTCPILVTDPSWSGGSIGAGGVSGLGAMEFYTGNDIQKLSTQEREDLEESFFVHKNDYHYYSFQLKTLIDGGNTQQFKVEIENLNEAGELRSEILNQSPYVSADALKEAIDKNGILPDAILFEILNANPDAVRDAVLLEYLENIENPLPQWMFDYLKDNMMNAITTRTMLEYAIQEAREKMILDGHAILQDIEFDSMGLDHQMMRYWLGQLEEASADYMIADDYIALEKYDDARGILDIIPSFYNLKAQEMAEYVTMLALDNWKIEMMENGSHSLQKLSNSELEALQSIVDTGYGQGKYKAENILNYFYTSNFEHLPELPSSNNQRRTNSNKIALAEDLSFIKVYPNPTKDLATFEYQLPCISHTGVLSITDMTGKIIYLNNKLVGEHNILNIQTKDWESANYLYKLVCDGIIIGEGKLTIIK